MQRIKLGIKRFASFSLVRESFACSVCSVDRAVSDSVATTVLVVDDFVGAAIVRTHAVRAVCVLLLKARAEEFRAILLRACRIWLDKYSTSVSA